MSNQERRKRMTGQTSKGTCTFCHRELSKASLTRHLVSCERRIAMQGETESRQQATKSKSKELVVKVLADQEVGMKGKAIEGLARNTLPIIPCDGCGGPVTHICTQCIYKHKGYLCATCARSHKCGEEMLLPLVNSPRAGVCG